jgi:hypothetical protein
MTVDLTGEESVAWLERARADTDGVEGKQWVPYEGPEGGSGWKNAESGEVRYQDDPPGETLASDPEDKPLSEGDRVLLEYDGEVHAGEVVAETPVDVRVRDDRNLWTLDKDESSQIDGAMEVRNLGAPESDKRDPMTMDIEDGDDLEYVASELDDEREVAERVLDAMDNMSTEDAYGAVDSSSMSTRVVAYEFERLAGGEAGGSEVQLDPSRASHDEHQERFAEQAGQQAVDDVNEAAWGWVGSMYRDDRAAPLVQHAMGETGNDTLPEYRGADRAAGEETEAGEMESMEAADEFTTETLREAFGDEITVFRGFSKDPHQGTPSEGTGVVADMERAKEAGEDVEINHRPAESWTLDPDTASLYADTSGAVVATEVPVEDALLSSSAGTIDAAEVETVLKHDGPETYDPDDIIMKGDMERKKADFLLAARAAGGTRK